MEIIIKSQIILVCYLCSASFSASKVIAWRCGFLFLYSFPQGRLVPVFVVQEDVIEGNEGDTRE